MKRILSLVLCVIMVMAIIPMTVAAEEELVEKELYSNDFSSAEKLEEGTHDDKITIEDGRLALTGSGNSTNGYWYKEIDVTEAENDTIIFKMRVWIPTKKSSAILYIAGTQVFSSVEQSGESRLSLGTRKIAVSDNGATGSGYLLTVNITKSTGAAKASLEDNGETVISGISFNFGPIGDTLLVKFGEMRYSTRYVDDLYVGTLSSAQQGATPPATEDVAAAMWVDGYQKTVVENGVYNARFVVVIKELFEGQNNVGVEITTTAGGGKSWDLFTNKVHRSITANFGTESVTATERGGQYITAAAITGVPESEGAIEFVITPYVTVGGVKVYGEAKTVTVDPAAAE